MLKKLLPLFFAAAFAASAAVPGSRGNESSNRQETINKEHMTMRNVRDFGAVGDGVTKDTAAIQRAIDAGGIVCFPAGVYLSGTLYLKSNGGLHLEPGAVLLASPDKEDYNADDFCPQNRVFKSERSSGAHFIVALEQRNVVLSGFGTIDGNRQAFYGEKNKEPSCAELNEKFPAKELENGWRPSQMLFFCECREVYVQDVKLWNSPQWSCFFHGCQDVFVRGLRILNDQRTHNGDGIDVDCCQRVTISDCIIDTGDDCITLRAADQTLKTKRPCEQIAVSNCILHTNCNALRLGVGFGTIRDAVFSNIVVHDSRTAVCVISNFGHDPEGGCGIENVSFENFRVNCIRVFEVYGYAHGAREVPPKREVRNIRFRNFTGVFTKPSQICGSQERGMTDVSVADFRLECLGNRVPLTEEYDGRFGEWGPNSPAAAFYVAHASDVEFYRCRVLWNGHDEWKHGVAAVHTKNLTVKDCDLGKEVYWAK